MSHRAKFSLIPILISFSFALFLPGCSRIRLGRASTETTLINWGYTDLRAIDPPDAAQADQDLLAVYLRENASPRNRLDIRLDLLDLPLTPSVDFWLAFDLLSGGVTALPSGGDADFQWDALVIVPANAPIQAFNAQMQPLQGLAVRVLRDPEQDSLSISMDAASLYNLTGLGVPPGLKIQIFSVAKDSSQIMDRSPIAALNAPAPQPAKLLLTFWNTFPAYTPAQALRHWDGAHTGLFGGRYGLYNLLRTARNHGIPLLLLDLKTPAWLSALDYAGDIDLVKNLAADRLIRIPDVWWSDQGADLAAYSVKLAESYGLPSGDIAYAQDTTSLPAKFRTVLIPSSDNQPFITVTRRASRRVIAIPIRYLQNNPYLKLDPDGLSLEARRLLASTASQAGNHPSILILGGDLTQSGWGSPEAARLAFTYIQNHPWIQVFRPVELDTLPIQPSPVDGSPLAQVTPGVQLTSPPTLSSDPFTQAAAQAAFVSSDISLESTEELSALRTIYSAQEKILLSAADWAKNPSPVAACDIDLDGDTIPECILGNETIYTVYNLTLGALTHAFALGNDGPHQWIGPSSQLTYGTSDPTTWDLSAGLSADPTVINGAFADTSGNQSSPYQAQIEPGKLSLISSNGTTVKAFTLMGSGLQVEINGPTGSSIQLPLIVDPWLRFQPGWWQNYSGQRDEGVVAWGTNDIQIRITSQNALTLSAFNDTRQWMGREENPNTEYPPGHYLPFPIALVKANVDKSLKFQISVLTK